MVKPLIKPLGNKVLVKPIPKQEKTTAGIIIPAVINKDLEEGEVMAVAESVINITPGMKILYPSRAGVSLMHNDVNYKFLSGPIISDPGEIIAII
jgi:chaperonin GroES